jgi:hypothetical protein
MLGSILLPGVMIRPPTDPNMPPGAAALMRRVDLNAIYEDVKRKIAKLSRRPAKRGRGRRRGLEGTKRQAK